jgi:hypothetical protein
MSYSQLVNDAAINAVNEILEVAKKSIDDKTPEDTRELVGNNEIESAREEQGGVITGAVVNTTSYAIYVEFGAFKGSDETPYEQRDGRSYNYHKPK